VRRSATIFFGAIDRTGQLEFVNAGHIAPLLIRNGQVGVVSEAGSWPVGLFQSAQYETHRASLQPGDTVILITDGITEAVNPAKELFGPERLLRSVERHAGKPVDELQAGILADVEEFSRGAHQADDITLLVVRYLGHRSG
jgi:sigma-B regulation protein RsbU (phosphoserine phosphatase)